MRFLILIVSLAGLLNEAQATERSAAETVPLPAGTVFFAVESGSRAPHLRAGIRIEGLIDPLYLEGRRILPAGSRIQTVVHRPIGAEDQRAMLSRVASFVWEPTGREEHKVRGALLNSSVLVLPDGQTHPLNVSLVDIFDLATVTPNSKHSSSTEPKAHRVRMIFRVNEATDLPAARIDPTFATVGPSTGELPAGTTIRVILVSRFSGRANHPGDAVEVYLPEPVRFPSGGELPDGTRLEGHVVYARPARRLRRGGKLQLAFNRLMLPGGETKEVSASLSAIELPKEESATVSNEGALVAGPDGLRSKAVDFAISYGLGKLTDDLAEEGIKALLIASAPAAAATAARYIGLGAGVAWYLAHRGREAVLPRYTYIEITFNRAVNVERPAQSLR